MKRSALWSLAGATACLVGVAALVSPVGGAGAVGGSGAVASTYAAVVRIATPGQDDGSACSGVFVGQDRVLTSTQCTGTDVVATGTSGVEQQWSVTDRTDHPTADLSILSVAPADTTGESVFLSLPMDFQGPVVGEPVTLVGYGYTFASGSTASPSLPDHQVGAAGKVTAVSGETFDVGGDAAVCTGDLGGPALRDGKVMGILTGFTGDMVNEQCGPGRYVSLQAYEQWITDLVAAAPPVDPGPAVCGADAFGQPQVCPDPRPTACSGTVNGRLTICLDTLPAVCRTATATSRPFCGIGPMIVPEGR